MNRCIICHDITTDYILLYSSEDSCYEACYPTSVPQPVPVHTCIRHKKELEESDIADYIVQCYEWNEGNFYKRVNINERINDYKSMIKGIMPPDTYGWSNKVRTRRKR